MNFVIVEHLIIFENTKLAKNNNLYIQDRAMVIADLDAAEDSLVTQKKKPGNIMNLKFFKELFHF